MKKTPFLTLIVAAALLVMAACTQKEDPLLHFTDGVNVTTKTPEYISGTTAVCGAEVTVDDAGLLIELGVCWSRSANPTVEDNVVKSHKCSEPFVGSLTNLEYETEYHVRGYAQYGTEFCYGEEKTFTTLDSLSPGASPVTTVEAYDITSSSFKSGVKIMPFGSTAIFAGVCYGQNPELDMYHCEEYVSGHIDDNGVCQVQCDWLAPNTQYYYRAFAYFDLGNGNTADVFYGEVLSLTTLDDPLEIELYTYYADYYCYGDGYWIEASGCVWCNKPQVINEVGFCYSSNNPYPQYESDSYIVAGTPTGNLYNFGRNIYDLSGNTKYYLCSYARYMTDSIQYGEIVTVDIH